jgi:hypothetical protein
VAAGTGWAEAARGLGEATMLCSTAEGVTDASAEPAVACDSWADGTAADGAPHAAQSAATSSEIALTGRRMRI